MYRVYGSRISYFTGKLEAYLRYRGHAYTLHPTYTHVREVAEGFALPYPQVRDRDLALTRRFEVEGTPTVLVLGPDGRLLYRGHAPPESWFSLVEAVDARDTR